MPTVETNLIATGGGVSISGRISRTVDSAGSSFEVQLAAGKAGTLSTRTDDETGTLTLGAGHGITTGQIIDLYWSGGARYGILVGTVAGVSVPIGADDVGTGDVLPAQATAIVACVRTVIGPLTLDGDNVSLAVFNLKTSSSAGKGHVELQDVADAVVEALDLVGNEPQTVVQSDTNLANALTGNVITEIHASNGDTTAATLQFVCGVDMTL